MGKGLRTHVKARKKSKYFGKEQMYHNLQVKESMKSKTKTNISKTHPYLLEVDIRGCEMITDKNIDEFVTVFKHLQVLKIGNNSNITDLSMKSIANNLPDLRTLDIR